MFVVGILVAELLGGRVLAVTCFVVGLSLAVRSSIAGRLRPKSEVLDRCVVEMSG